MINKNYLFFDDMMDVKILDPIKIKVKRKFMQKYFYVPHWMHNGQRP